MSLKPASPARQSDRQAVSMPTRPVGRSGLEVTVLGFGGVQVGDYFVRMPEAVARATIEEAWAQGVRYFDTAPRYGSGLSEHRIGSVLRDRPRSDFVLSTKTGRNLIPDAETTDSDRLGLPFRQVPDLSRDGTLRGVEQSLHRLGLSRIDMMYIHALEPREYGEEYESRFCEAMAGTWPALASLRDEGVIRGIGAGINETEAAARLMRETDLDCMMLAGRYTLIDQSGLDEVLPLAAARGVSIVIGAPFNSGILATGDGPDARYWNRPPPPDVRDKVATLARLCDELAIPMAAAALQFPLAHPQVASVVPGVSSAEEVASNADLLRRTISADFWAALLDADVLEARSPVPQG